MKKRQCELTPLFRVLVYPDRKQKTQCNMKQPRNAPNIGTSPARVSDQYQYLGNCPPTPPLTQQQSIDNKLGLMLG